MLNFVKKFYIFSNKKSGPVTGLIKDEEIYAISDELSIESIITSNSDNLSSSSI